jgi:hemolysin III
MWMRRLDHAAIFVLISGTATPLCLLRLPERSGQTLLFWVWALALLGSIKSLIWVRIPKAISSLLYVATGCVALLYFKDFQASLSPMEFALLLAGGLVYAAGALVYALKRPDPLPQVFGYHEIFHLLVVVAAALHFAVIEMSANWIR